MLHLCNYLMPFSSFQKVFSTRIAFLCYDTLTHTHTSSLWVNNAVMENVVYGLLCILKPIVLYLIYTI